MIAYDDDGKLVNLADFLVKRGVEINIMTDADVVQEQYLRYQAAVAVKYGLDPAAGAPVITLNPARSYGLGDADRQPRAGQGRRPRRVRRRSVRHCRARTLMVIIDGRVVFEAGKEREVKGGAR